MDNTAPRRAPARRALLIGGSAADGDRLAGLLAPEAQVICFAADRASGEAIREAIVRRAPTARVAIMLGEPALLVHKVAGPFDVIVDAHPDGETRRDRLQMLAAEGGVVHG